MKYVLIFAMITLLTACSTKLVEQIYHQPDKTETACLQACAATFKQCRNTCHNSCKNCQKQSHCSTLKGYKHYLRVQQVTGDLLARDKHSYQDPLRCTKVSCNCCADVDVCKQSCLGQIKKQMLPRQTCC